MYKGKSDTYKHWHMAFVTILDKMNVNQTEIAEAIGVSAQHISDVKRGQKGASQIFQENVAKFLGLSLSEMVVLGQEIDMHGDKYPINTYIYVLTGKTKKDRAIRVLNSALKENGLNQMINFNGSNLNINILPFIKSYLSGYISITECYRAAHEHFKRISEEVLVIVEDKCFQDMRLKNDERK